MESKVGSILSLIGGILQLVSALIFLILALTAIMAGIAGLGTIIGVVYLILAVVYIVMGILAIKASKWMKAAETTKKGGITALVCGIVGFNIVTLIGGILGLVDAGK